MKKKNSEKKYIAQCESTKGLSALEGAQKTEGKRKGLKKLGGDMEKIDENYKLHFDAKQAIKDGLPPEMVYFGLKAERVNNELIYELKTYEEVSEETIREIDTLYGPSFKYTSSQPSDKSQTRAEACGGGYDNLHTCPPRLDSGFIGIHGTI